jgi:hypothetical protein
MQPDIFMSHARADGAEYRAPSGNATRTPARLDEWFE